MRFAGMIDNDMPEPMRPADILSRLNFSGWAVVKKARIAGAQVERIAIFGKRVQVLPLGPLHPAAVACPELFLVVELVRQVERWIGARILP